MRILVCGSRDYGEERGLLKMYTDRALYEQRVLYCTLNGYAIGCENYVTIIEGECPYGGADIWARKWADAHKYKVEPYPANWYPNGEDAGRDPSAGPRRNTRMLIEGKPDVVIGFVNHPLSESRGTADMLRKARAAKVRTFHVEVY